MTQTTQRSASDRLNSRIAACSDAMLIETLRTIDRLLSGGHYLAEERPHRVLVRARLIAEAEKRWPAADAAVAAAFETNDAALQRGEDVPDVDYVAVLLANIPH